MFRRRVKDSQGNWGEIILFSELSNPDKQGDDGEQLSTEEIAENFISHIPRIGMGDIDSENDEEKEKYKKLLKFAFTLLPPKQQYVVYLYYYKNKNYSEIARTVGVSPSAIRQIMKVSIMNLREVILEDKPNLQKSANNKKVKSKKKKDLYKVDLFSILL
jgi:RNA polymerase sigma factor (sigma-70 family)